METWQLQDAKTKFSQLVDKAIAGSPQLVTRYGEPAVIVISAKDYKESQEEDNRNFINFLLSIPKSDDDEDWFVRENGTMRDIDL